MECGVRRQRPLPPRVSAGPFRRCPFPAVPPAVPLSGCGLPAVGSFLLPWGKSAHRRRRRLPNPLS
jgi:hypothetical protein